MKAEIKIPVGYRRLRKGEIIKAGDRAYHNEFFHTFAIGYKVGDAWADCEPYIRRIKRAKPVKKSPIRKIKNPKRKP